MESLDTGLIVAVAASLVGWGLVSAKLKSFNVSAPMAFVAIGLVLANAPVSAIDVDVHRETLRSLAEVTLALLLFSDAARVNLRVLRHDARRADCGSCSSDSRSRWRSAPRLAVLLFPDLDPWAAAVIAAAVAPTDAALGAQVVEDTHVPGADPPDPQRRERVERRHRHTVRDLLHRRRGRRHGRALVDQHSGVRSPISASACSSARAVGLGGGLLLKFGHEPRAGRRPRIGASACWRWRSWPARSRSSSGATGSSARSSAGSRSAPCVPRSRAAGDDARVRRPGRRAAVPGRLVPLRRRAGDGARRDDVADRGVRDPRPHRGAHGSGGDRARRDAVHADDGRASSAGSGRAGWPRSCSPCSPIDCARGSEAKTVLAAITLTVLLSVFAHGFSAAPLSRRYGEHVATLAEGTPERDGGTQARNPAPRRRHGRLPVPQSGARGVSPTRSLRGRNGRPHVTADS